MASISPHKQGYRAQVYVQGVRDSKIFRTKREADAWASARETEIRAEASKPAGQRHTLRDAFAKYREEVSPTKRGKRWEELRLKAFERDALLPCGQPVGSLTSEMLGMWRDARLRQVSAGTVLRELGLLSAVLEEARREWRWVDINAAKDVRRPHAPDHREVVITRAQIRIMLGEMGYSPRLPIRTVSQAAAVCFLMALRSGMRAGELCGLTWDRVFDGYCRTPHKNGRSATTLRDVPLTAKAERLVKRMKGWDQELVFCLKSATLDSLFRRYRDRAGLSGFTFHDSRHTAATWVAARMKSNGLPAQQALLDLCKMFGWTKLDQALTYYNPSAADIAKRIV